jgi:hypothetical protein
MLMAKEKDRIELKQVDEEAEKVNRFVRLHPDAVEEVEDLPPVRVGGKDTPEARLDATRGELKRRSNEPDVGSLIEREEIQTEDQWDAAGGRNMPWGWIALLGCIFAGGILWSLLEVNRAKDRQGMLSEEVESILEKEHREEMDAEQTIGVIETAVQNFFDSRSVEEMLRYVRHPLRMVPLMEKEYRKSPPIPLRVEKVLSMDPLTIDNRASFWMVSCELEGAQVRQVLVEVVSSNEAKVDWETYVCHQSMDWDEFAKSRPGGFTGDFRVYAEPDNYYSYEFADSDAFVSFRLTALDSEDVLYGYVDRGGEIAKRMARVFERNGGGVTPMILRLHLPEGITSKRGVVVKDMICPRWLFVENPEEDNP